MKIEAKHKLGNEITVRVIKPDGRKILVAEKVPNMITDFGMTRIGNQPLNQIFTPTVSSQVTCRWGDGSTANAIDSGTVTASQSGTTITADGNIFTLDMEGDLIKYDSDEEIYLQTYVSPTEFTASSAATIASSEFTIYDVNRVALDNQIQSTTALNATSTYALETGICKGTSVFIFSALGSGGTCREIAWSPLSQTNIAARVVVADIALSVGDQLEVTTEFSITQNYQTTTAIDPTTGEGDFSCDVQIEGPALMGINNSADTLEPSTTSYLYLVTSTEAFNSYGTISAKTTTGRKILTKSSAPTSPPWTLTKSVTYTTSEVNISTINGMLIGVGGNDTEQSAGLRIKFPSAKTKTNLQTLTISIPITWDRNLTN